MRTFTRIFTLLCAAVLLLTGCTAAQPEIIRTEADPVENAEWKMGFGDAVVSHDGLEGPFYIAGYDMGREFTDIIDEMRASAVWMDMAGKAFSSSAWTAWVWDVTGSRISAPRSPRSAWKPDALP